MEKKLAIQENVMLVRIHQLFTIGIKNVKIQWDAKNLNANVMMNVEKDFHARMVLA